MNIRKLLILRSLWAAQWLNSFINERSGFVSGLTVIRRSFFGARKATVDSAANRCRDVFRGERKKTPNRRLIYDQSHP